MNHPSDNQSTRRRRVFQSPGQRRHRLFLPSPKRSLTPVHVEVELDGERLLAVPGISVASLLAARGYQGWRRNQVTGQLRGPFCGMGVCFECELTVDGRPGSRACLEQVREGMRIVTEVGTIG